LNLLNLEKSLSEVSIFRSFKLLMIFPTSNTLQTQHENDHEKKNINAIGFNLKMEQTRTMCAGTNSLVFR